MRYILLILALAGIVVSSLALREHYREGESPCSINDKWDCGIVNKSEYAVVGGIALFVQERWGHSTVGYTQASTESSSGKLVSAVKSFPIAAVGILGYLLMGALGVIRRYSALMVCLIGSLFFSAWLSYVEDKVLGVWCLYCVISAGIVVLMSILTGGTLLAKFLGRKRERFAV